MPAGGGRQAMNHVYNVAPSDGTAFGTTLRNIAFDPLFGEEATRIDARQAFVDRQPQQRGERVRRLAHLTVPYRRPIFRRRRS